MGAGYHLPNGTKRRKKNGKGAFHEREALMQEAEEAQDGPARPVEGEDGAKGHNLWRGTDRLSGWGVTA